MKWFKHYENAQTNNFIQALLSEKNGLELYAQYFLLLEFLCRDFKKDTTMFIVSNNQLKTALRVRQDSKLKKVLEVFNNFSATFDRNLLEISEVSGKTSGLSKKFWEIKTPIILELIGKEFKRTRARGVMPTAKKKEERIKNKNKNILSSKSSTVCVEIIDYLNLKTGKSFKSTSKATQSAISARCSEGFLLKDFKHVIDVKSAEWGVDDKMKKFLQPSTLFGPKFENYRQQEPPQTKESLDAELIAILNGKGAPV